MKTTKRLTLAALLTALALALSYMERFIPFSLLIPLPGVKPGLANVVTLYALIALDAPMAWTVLCARVFLGALFAGNFSALLYAATGGVFALTVMILSLKTKRFSLYGVSMLGAAAHNTGQTLAAYAVLGSSAVFGYLPLLLLTSLLMGSLTGLTASLLFRATDAAGLSR